MDFDYVALGKSVKKFRKAKGLRQSQLAEMIDKTDSHVGHIENARGKASLETVVAIANALDVGLDQLVYGNLVHKMDYYIEEIIRLTARFSREDMDLAMDRFCLCSSYWRNIGQIKNNEGRIKVIVLSFRSAYGA